ncbi:MAG: YggS family pyridoxal phosphate-dependent enzyme [Spirochaetes bacterium]|nr:YggS family pyridoxal phosphate-dependent enzyme [Spirochaetota bacterium]
MTISDNYNSIKEKVNETAIKCSRKSDEIKIVAVSKTFNEDVICEAINSGIDIFGENRIQEAGRKFKSLCGNFKLHMVGHLQSNKSDEAIKLFDLIHSVDKISTASKLNSEAQKINKIQSILLQLKTSDEDTKHGANPSEIIPIAESILNMGNLKLEGIMSIGPNTSDKSIIRKSFTETSKALDKINSALNLNLKELSMGMSGDYTIAIEEGATLIRIGTAIFGNR